MDTNSRACGKLDSRPSTARGQKDEAHCADSRSYEPLACEYYAPRHITSRNFDAATRAWLRKQSLEIPGGYALDLGAGRGAIQTYCGLASRRIVQADVSFSLLTLEPREPSLARVNCDALALPFTDESFGAVMAFLFDPFNRPRLVFETFRVLRPGGLFVGTLPHYLWGRTLRSLRRIDPDATRFLLASGEYSERDSYLTEELALQRRFARAGYHPVRTTSLVLPGEVKTISPDIRDAAASLGMSPYELPIISLLIACKP